MPEQLGCDDADLDRGAKLYIEQLLVSGTAHASPVLKSPNLTHLIPDLHRFFDKPIRTICIVRDPRDTIASLLRVRHRQGMKPDLVDAANFLGGFYDDIGRAVGGQQFANSVHLVRYEDLAAEDHDTLALLARFIGQPICLAEGLNERWLDPANPWHSDLYSKPITAERIGSYKDYLTPDEIGAIDESYARFYERFGYARHEETPSVSQAA